MSRPPSSADSQLSLKFQSEGLKDSEDTQYSRLVELNLTCNVRSLSSISGSASWPCTWPRPNCGTQDPGKVMRGWGRASLVSCGGFFTSFTLGFRVHVLPITDKGEAVLCCMWFHLEQVKQCRKIDPSSVAFQRPVRNSTKS